MAGNIEEFILRLNEQISPAARVANSALGQLEARIGQQKVAIAAYETSLAKAAAKLQEMTKQGQTGAVNIAAFKRQQEVVAGLQQKLDDAHAAMGKLEGARPLAETVSSFQAARGEITAAVAALRELEAQQQMAAAAGSSGQVDALTAAIERQKAAILATQQAYVQMGGSSADAIAAGGAPAAARETASAMQVAEQAIEAAASAFAELHAQQQLLAAGGGTKAQMDAITAAIEKQRAAVVRTQQAYVQMGGSSQKALSLGGNQAQTSSLKMNELAEGFGQLGGPIGQAGTRVFGLGEGLKKLKGSLGGAGVAAIAAAAAIAIVVVAVVALSAAAVIGTVKIAQLGVELADTARTSRLTTAALEQTHKSLAGLGSIMPAVTRATGVGVDQLRGLAKQLADAKVSAANMPAALKAVAMAEAALGQGGAAQFIADLKAGKISVTKLAAEMESKFGGIVKAKLISLDSLTARFKRTLGETFGGLKIEGLLGVFSKLIDMFDTANGSGRTMKVLFESFFQPLIDSAVGAWPILEAFIIGIEIGLLKLAITFKPVGRAIKKLLGTDDKSLESTLDAAAAAGEIFAVVVVAGMVAVAVGIALVVVGIGLLIAAAALIAAPFVLMGAMVLAPFLLIAAAIYGLGSLVVYLVGLGGQLIAGLAKGIAGAAEKVIGAIVDVVKSGISAATKLLKITSPSRVFMEIGAHTSEGMALGIESGTARVQDAVTEMAAPESVPEFSPGGSGRSTGGGKRYEISFNECIFGEGLTKESLREMLLPLFHEASLELT